MNIQRVCSFADANHHSCSQEITQNKNNRQGTPTRHCASVQWTSAFERKLISWCLQNLPEVWLAPFWPQQTLTDGLFAAVWPHIEKAKQHEVVLLHSEIRPSRRQEVVRYSCRCNRRQNLNNVCVICLAYRTFVTQAPIAFTQQNKRLHSVPWYKSSTHNINNPNIKISEIRNIKRISSQFRFLTITYYNSNYCL